MLAQLALASFLLILSGCGFGTRFIFSSNSDNLGTPAKIDLPFEEIWFPSEDGTLLHGWYIPGVTEQPLVMFFHGNAANITHRLDNIAFLNSMGLPVFIFDYRGYGISKGRALAEEDLYRDARGALQWLESKGWQIDRIIYYGRSMGAAVALQMAIERPPGGVVLECAFTNLSDIAWEMTPVTYALVGWWSIDARFDNMEKIPHLQRPLLMFHGEKDKIIPWAMGKKLFETAPEPKTFSSVPDGGHSDAFQSGGEAYRLAWNNFRYQIENYTALRYSSPPLLKQRDLK